MKNNKEYRYIIETGDYKIKESATTMMDATVLAFILKPPKNPSMLTRIKRERGNHLTGIKEKTKEYVWHYIDTRVLLKKAGFKVENK